VADLESYQLRLFGRDGSLRRTYGQAGGYASTTNPAVTHDRFWWTTTDFGVGNDRGTTLAYEPDGSFWVGDAGNRRTLHLSANGSYMGQLMYQPRAYTSAVVAAAPHRVFINFMEFEVDYTQPIETGWTLVRNWGAGMPKSFVAWDPAMGVAADAQNPPCQTDVCPGSARSPTGISRYPFAGFKDVAVSSTNHTLGIVGIFPRAPALDNVSNMLVVELTAGRGLREVANLSCATCPSYLRTCRMTATADLRCVESGGNQHIQGGAWQAVHQIELTVNASGFPEYELNSATVLTNFSFSLGELGVRPSMVNPHVPSMVNPHVPSGGGLVIFDASPGNDLSIGKGKPAPDTANQGSHLGAVSPLTGKWIWQASPWGRYEAEDVELSLLPEANVTFRQRALKKSTKIGTYGGNDTSVDFAGSTVMVQVSVNVCHQFGSAQLPDRLFVLCPISGFECGVWILWRRLEW
jgi:hypothetical protein